MIRNREALAARNRALAHAYHRLSFKERLRRALLVDLARLPIPTVKPKTERLLLIRPDHLGDVLLTTPAIRALRESRPNAEIHALVGPWSADVLSAYDEIDVVLTLPFPGFNRARSGSEPPYALLIRSARHLRRIGYSAAFLFRPDHWWGALLAKVAGIPQRIGYTMPDVKRFLTHGVERQGGHAVEQSLRLVEYWTQGARGDVTLRFPVDPVDRAYVDSTLEAWGIAPNQKLIAIHPGAGTQVKQWEPAQWTVVADTLSDQLDAAIVLTGNDRELPIVRHIADSMSSRACLMVGETSIGQLAALYARSAVTLGPDSGPLHLAVAVGTPTVTLFGPADPIQFGPWGSPDKHRVLVSSIGCRPCRVLDWSGDEPANHPCVRDIPVGQVLEAARRVARR